MQLVSKYKARNEEVLKEVLESTTANRQEHQKVNADLNKIIADIDSAVDTSASDGQKRWLGMADLLGFSSPDKRKSQKIKQFTEKRAALDNVISEYDHQLVNCRENAVKLRKEKVKVQEYMAVLFESVQDLNENYRAGLEKQSQDLDNIMETGVRENLDDLESKKIEIMNELEFSEYDKDTLCEALDLLTSRLDFLEDAEKDNRDQRTNSRFMRKKSLTKKYELEKEIRSLEQDVQNGSVQTYGVAIKAIDDAENAREEANEINVKTRKAAGSYMGAVMGEMQKGPKKQSSYDNGARSEELRKALDDANQAIIDKVKSRLYGAKTEARTNITAQPQKKPSVKYAPVVTESVRVGDHVEPSSPVQPYAGGNGRDMTPPADYK